MSARTIIFLLIFLLIAGGWFVLDRQAEQMFEQVAMQQDSAMADRTGSTGAPAPAAPAASGQGSAHTGAGKPIAVVDHTGKITMIEGADEMSREEAEARAAELAARAREAESQQRSASSAYAADEARRRAEVEMRIAEERAQEEARRAHEAFERRRASAERAEEPVEQIKVPAASAATPPAPTAPAAPAPQPAPATSDPELPPFPWPPPKTSAYHTVPRDVFVQAGLASAPNLAAIGSRIEAALDQAAYSERSYHSVPNGFALATRIERIRADGAPDYERRWIVDDDSGSFSLLSYLEKILYGDPGRFRVIVFVVTDQSFSATGEALTASEARELTSSGLLSLPRSFREIEFGPDHRVVALIYEFFKPEGGQPLQVLPGTLAGIEHLEGAKLASALTAER